MFTAFSGYDSQLMAIRNLGIPYECVGWSEIDRYAIEAHNAVFPEWADRNRGDISAVNWAEVPDFDLFTYSFPCTDLSQAGRQAGFAEGSGTRSSLLWECRKAVEAKHPGYLLLENVKALVSGKFKPGLLKWMNFLSEQGYTNFVDVLNAKDYNVPQNRERVFLVSILGDAWFTFPQPVELKTRLADVLERDVNEKYYLAQEKVQKFIDGLSPEKREELERG